MAVLIAVVAVLRHGRFVRHMSISIVMAGFGVMMAAFGESLAIGMSVRIVSMIAMVAVIMMMLVVVRRHGRLGMVAAVIVMA